MKPTTAIWLTAKVLGHWSFILLIGLLTLIMMTHKLSQWDIREITQGDKPHPTFTLLAQPENKKEPLPVLLSELESFQHKHPQATFLLPKQKHTFTLKDKNPATYLQTPLATGGVQVEVIIQKEKNTLISHYSVVDGKITPTYSRWLSTHYLKGAFPYAGGVMATSLLLSYLLRRKGTPPEES